jgi:hypothetical protein
VVRYLEADDEDAYQEQRVYNRRLRGTNDPAEWEDWGEDEDDE